MLNGIAPFWDLRSTSDYISLSKGALQSFSAAQLIQRLMFRSSRLVLLTSFSERLVADHRMTKKTYILRIALKTDLRSIAKVNEICIKEASLFFTELDDVCPLCEPPEGLESA
ncbi:hypothetical protein KRMM14A1004_07360 [Krasilnikovia sp. MM14-A1004]